MRSMHNLSHEHKTSVDMGNLIPIACLEVLPGDSFMQATSILARVAPLVNPVMHTVDLRLHHWYVPNRLSWEHWEEWIVGKSTEDHPTVTHDDDTKFLLDYLGLPHPAHVNSPTYSAFPVRAYNMIYNEFYRDQDLQTPRDVDDLSVARCAWEKDYFTTARPYPQQGDPISVGFASGSVPVISSHNQTNSWSSNDRRWPAQVASVTTPAPPNGPSGWLSFDNVRADLSQATGGIDINDLRRAIALQRFAEARMRFGSRYIDYLRFLGVNPSDGRLDRPEYLGGGKQTINFSEVIALAEGANTNVGDLYGHGIAGLRTRRYRKLFEEHGWVLTLLSARPKTVYMDAVPRKFTRFDPMDYWQKELEVLPWQEVKQSEVHWDGDADTVFGYVPRYDDYRHELSYVSGSFRNGPEIDWHYARTFSSAPTLNSAFIQCDPTDRVYADTDMPELLIAARHSIQAKRLVRSNASLSSI